MAAAAIAVAACAQSNDAALKEKVDSYAVVEVSSPLYDALSENDKKIVSLFRQAGEIIDGLFWKQTFGDKALIDAAKEDLQKTLYDISSKMYQAAQAAGAAPGADPTATQAPEGNVYDADFTDVDGQ